MSFILDALRKAERDRNLGRTPSLGDVTAHPARARSPATARRTWMLLGLVAGLVLLVLLTWPRESRVVTPPAAIAPAPAPVPADPPAPVAPAAPVAMDLQPLPDVPDIGPEADTFDDLLGDDPSLTGAVDEGAPVPDDDPGTVAEPRESLEPTAPPAPAPPADAAADTPPDVPPPTPPAEPVPGAPGAPTPLRDMPSDYRAAFPELRVDVHVFDPDPSRRWALVNGRKLVEGGTLAEGPRLQQITAEGLVFEFNGRSTLLRLDRGR